MYCAHSDSFSNHAQDQQPTLQNVFKVSMQIVSFVCCTVVVKKTALIKMTLVCVCVCVSLPYKCSLLCGIQRHQSYKAGD